MFRTSGGCLPCWIERCLPIQRLEGENDQLGLGEANRYSVAMPVTRLPGFFHLPAIPTDLWGLLWATCVWDCFILFASWVLSIWWLFSYFFAQWTTLKPCSLPPFSGQLEAFTRTELREMFCDLAEGLAVQSLPSRVLHVKQSQVVFLKPQMKPPVLSTVGFYDVTKGPGTWVFCRIMYFVQLSKMKWELFVVFFHSAFAFAL